MPFIADIFHNDAFTFFEMVQAIDKVPFNPGMLGQLGLFTERPIRTTAMFLEERDQQLTIIPFSDRGSPGTERTSELRKARYFKVPRMFHEDTIYATELADIRQFDAEGQVMEIQTEMARRFSGDTGIVANIEYTTEYHRLGAVQGQLLDADGTLMYDWFEEFGITRPTPFQFNIQADLTNTIRPICNQVIRAMARAGQGAFIQGRTKVYALCGDVFYDALVNHPDVIRTFTNWQAAVDIRDGTQGAAFDTFRFGGIYWINYRGSDDTTTIAIPPNGAQFFPVDAPGVFQMALAPGESFDTVNQPGLSYYPKIIWDKDRDEWVKVEVKSYRLPICTRPAMLQSAIN